MTFQLAAPIIPLLIGAFITSALAYYVWRRRSEPGAIPLVLLMLAVTEWSLGYAFELAGASLSAKMLGAKLQYIGVVIIPTVWLVLTLQYGGYEKWMTRRRLLLLSIQPLVTLVIAWNGRFDRLIWQNPHLGANGLVMAVTNGYWFWVNVAYSYLLLFIGTLLLIQMFIRSPYLYRGQVGALLLGAAAPWLGNALYISKLNPFSPLDPTPFAFTFTSLAWFWALFRFRLLDMAPVARATLVESMADGVIVLDKQDRVVDLNPAAQRITGLAASSAIGQPVSRVFPAAVALLAQYRPEEEAQAEVVSNVKGATSYFDCRLSPLIGHNGRLHGRLLTLHDITKRKSSEETLRRYTTRLQLSHEIDQAILAAHPPEQIAHIALRYVREQIPSLRADVFVFDFAVDEAVLIAVDTDEPTAVGVGFRAPTAVFAVNEELGQGGIYKADDNRLLPQLPEIGQKLLAEGMRSFINVPLIAQSELIGALNVASKTPYAFTPATIAVASEVAKPLAIAMQQARLYAQAESQAVTLRRREQYLTRLNDITRTAVSQIDSQTMLQALADTLLGFDDADNCFLTTWDETRRRATFTAVSGQFKPPFADIQAQPGQVLLIESVLKEGRPLPIANVHDTPYVSPEIAARFPSRSVLALPLTNGGQKLGAAIIAYNQPHQFTEDEIKYGLQAAAQISLALAKAQLLETEREQRALAESLRQTAIALSATLDVDSIMDQLLERVGRIIPFDMATILLVEDGRASVARQRGYEQFGEDAVNQIFSLSFAVTTTANLHQMAESGRPLIIPDVKKYPDWIVHETTEHIRALLCAPIIIQGQLLAFFSLEKTTPDFYQPEHVKRLTALAGQAALSLQNARLYQETRRSAEELGIASHILRHLNATPDIQAALPEITAVLQQLTGCHRVAIFLLDQNQAWGQLIVLKQAADAFKQNRRLNLADTAAAPTVMAGRTHFTPDLAAETTFPAEKILYQAGYRSRLALPLYTGDKVMGSLNLGWRQPAGYNMDDLPLLRQIADGIALAVGRSRLFDEINRHVDQLAILNHLSRQATSALDSQELYTTVVRTLCASLNHTRMSIFTVDPEAKVVNLQAIVDSEAGDIPVEKYHQAFGEGLIGRAAATGERIVINDTTQHPDFLESSHYPIRSELVIPIKVGDQVIGVLNADSRELNAFNEHDVAILSLVTDQLAAFLEKSQLFAETRQRAVELEILTEISTALRISETVADIVSVLLEKVAFEEPTVRAIYLLEPETGRLVVRGSVPEMDGFVGSYHQPGEGITGQVAATGNIHVSPHLAIDPEAILLPQEREILEKAFSSVAVPLRAQEHTVGVLHVALMVKRPFSEAEIRLLKAISEIAGSALHRAQVLGTLEQHVAARTYELARANEQLQELDKLKSKFVSDVSHELRTPITNLSLYLDLIDKGRPEKRQQYLEVLRKQTDRLKNLIEDTLSLSRLDMGKIKRGLTPIALNPVIEQVITAHLPRLEAAGLELITDLQPDLPPLNGEPNQLAQVITNLLANAINYTPAGQIFVRTFMDEKGSLCLEVEDTGLGIAKGDMVHLFDRFYRGQNASKLNVPGTGLGLAIVQEIVNLHGGEITVQSSEGKGVTFQVCLPVA